MLRRGTTPTCTFTTPYQASEIQKGYITFKQRSSVILEKSLDSDDVVVQDESIDVYLSQKDTLKFYQNAKAEVQIRLLLNDANKAVASNIIEFCIDPILKEGEI